MAGTHPPKHTKHSKHKRPTPTKPVLAKTSSGHARFLAMSIAALGALTFAVQRFIRRRSLTTARAQLLQRGSAVASSSADDLSIISYNMLADAFISSQKHVNPTYLTWAHRWPLTQSLLASWGADILCLQEVDTDRWDEICSSPALAGYSGLLQEKKDHGVANAIMYRSDRMGLVWSDHRTRAVLAAFTFWDAEGQQQLLYVANAHLEGSPYRPNDRISQMRSALQRIHQHLQQHNLRPQDCMVLVAGDFNSGPNETVCQYLYRGHLEGGTTEAHLPHTPVTNTTISHPFALADVYEAGGHILPFTRRVPALASTLDYIWASTHLQPIALYNPLDAQLSHCNSFPNAAHPSDHLPIGAVLRLKRA